MGTKLQIYVDQATKRGVPLSQLMVEQEARIQSMTEEEVLRGMARTYIVQRKAVTAGRHYDTPYLSDITGDVAGQMENYLKNHEPLTDRFTGEVILRALSASKSNSMMNVIVAAPTAGSSGVIPAVLTCLEDYRDICRDQIVRSLFTAGLVGTVVASQVTLAGAAGGCMAECGTASAMAAASATEVMGGSPDQVSNAAALAMKQHLGLVCDPVAGLVECPCIKRNAMSATVALAATEMALAGIPSVVPFDEVLIAMREVADKMDVTLRETSLGGLARTPTGKRIQHRAVEVETQLIDDSDEY